MSEPSVFMKIINGEISCHRVYEDEKTIAFLTIAPVREGHTLVIPKKQVDQYIDLDDEYYSATWLTAKKVAKRLRDSTGKQRIGIVVKGVDVPHFHVHLIPFDEGESLKGGDGDEADPAQLAAIAEKLKF